MQEPMNALHTDTVELTFEVPVGRVDEARRLMHEHGFEPTPDSVPWREVLMKGNVNLPGSNLAGARFKEGMTQTQLAQMTGIPRRHISEMENNRRGIGRQNARKLAAALNIDPRLLLAL